MYSFSGSTTSLVASREVANWLLEFAEKFPLDREIALELPAQAAIAQTIRFRTAKMVVLGTGILMMRTGRRMLRFPWAMSWTCKTRYFLVCETWDVWPKTWERKLPRGSRNLPPRITENCGASSAERNRTEAPIIVSHKTVRSLVSANIAAPDAATLSGQG